VRDGREMGVSSEVVPAEWSLTMFSRASEGRIGGEASAVDGANSM
jgi:hypothetical protein